MASTTTSAATSAATSSSSNNNSNGSGPTSSPLLFFVALGFGVVFTNLWIIVGVKYCFRYNQRNRAARMGDGDPIDLGAMPRPHRRRREKKLMTTEEVNERFPLIKYKTWRAGREQEGLPTEGGIATTAPSRAASVKDAEGTIGERASTDSHRPGTALERAQQDHADAVEAATSSAAAQPSEKTPEKAVDQAAEQEKSTEKMPDLHATQTATSTLADTSKPEVVETADPDDDDDDDPIRTASAPEMMAPPGDTCAICLDTLEDDDDVRGLTCGHAFHAPCVDPWLTTRRACCPLCKADYYVPKPRPEGEVPTDLGSAGRRPTAFGSFTGLNMPRSPQSTFSRPRMIFLAGPRSATTDMRGMYPIDRDRDPHRSPRTNRWPSSHGQRPTQQEPPSWRTRLHAFRNSHRPTLPSMPSVPNPFRRGASQNAGDNAAQTTTPSALEAGTRS